VNKYIEAIKGLHYVANETTKTYSDPLWNNEHYILWMGVRVSGYVAVTSMTLIAACTLGKK
jgi:hypothetical protein